MDDTCHVTNRSETFSYSQFIQHRPPSCPQPSHPHNASNQRSSSAVSAPEPNLAQHIQEFARGNSTVSSAEFDFLRYDHKDHVYARLRKAQTGHEGAKEHVRSLEMAANDEAEGAKRGG